jgi:hypothetical protein
MDLHLTYQSTPVATRDLGQSEDGLLISANGHLVAVITHLQSSVTEELQGLWFLEAGFGFCANKDHPTWDTQEQAKQWVIDRYNDHLFKELARDLEKLKQHPSHLLSSEDLPISSEA